MIEFEIEIEVNRALCSENWNIIEPFAVELIGKENKCCVCGTAKVTPFLRIHGLDVRGARTAVGLFHCPDHSDHHKVWDYTLANGLLMVEKPDLKPIGKWFNLPWWELQKIVYSRTEYEKAFPRYDLNRAFVGVGNLCRKSVEITHLADYYVVESEERKVQDSDEEFYPSVDLEGTYTFDNIHKYRFHVPKEVYVVKEYYERLNNAKTLSEVDTIIEEYKSKKEKALKKHW